MIYRYANESSIMFQATAVHATLPNGNEIDFLGRASLQSSTNPVTGEHVLELQNGEEDEGGSALIRLYLTTPKSDWRRNVSYAWKLSLATMQLPNDKNNETQFLYWNTENNINSEIMVEEEESLFSAESITIHFGDMSRRPQFQLPPITKLVMENVLLAAYFPSQPPLAMYRPCSSPVCEITDGVVLSSSHNSFANSPLASSGFDLEGAPLYGMMAGFAGVCILVLWKLVQCRRLLAQKYTPIDEHDLTLGEEDAFHDDDDNNGR